MKSKPRYEEIADWLRTVISNGREGDLLPTEMELADKFSVSRMTARQAVREVASEGLVTRTQGSGTFIAPLSLHRRRGPIESFHADIAARGMQPRTRLIEQGLRDSTAEEREALGTSQVISIRRLRSANGVPLAIENAALIPECADVLSEDLETTSLYAALRALGHTPSRAQAKITARLPTPEEAALLQQAETQPVLVEDRVVVNQEDAPLDMTSAVYAAGRYAIDAEFVLQPSTSQRNARASD